MEDNNSHIFGVHIHTLNLNTRREKFLGKESKGFLNPRANIDNIRILQKNCLVGGVN